MKSHRTAWFWCFLLIVWRFDIGWSAAPQVEVIAESAQVKIETETIAVVKKGQAFRLLKTQGSWVAIQIEIGGKPKRGWVLASGETAC